MLERPLPHIPLKNSEENRAQHPTSNSLEFFTKKTPAPSKAQKGSQKNANSFEKGHLPSKKNFHDDSIRILKTRRVAHFLDRESTRMHLEELERFEKTKPSNAKQMLQSLRSFFKVQNPGFKRLSDEELLLWRDESFHQFLAGSFLTWVWMALFVAIGSCVYHGIMDIIDSLLLGHLGEILLSTGWLALAIVLTLIPYGMMKNGGPLHQKQRISQWFEFKKEIQRRSEQEQLKKTLITLKKTPPPPLSQPDFLTKKID